MRLRCKACQATVDHPPDRTLTFCPYCQAGWWGTLHDGKGALVTGEAAVPALTLTEDDKRFLRSLRISAA